MIQWVRRWTLLIGCRISWKVKKYDNLRIYKNISCIFLNTYEEKIEKGNGRAEVEISEEFRSLTLEVIGEAVLSMCPSESDKVFPSLHPLNILHYSFLFLFDTSRYLPIVEFANQKLWNPWKGYIPTSTGLQAFWAIRALNKFITKKINERINSFNPAHPPNEVVSLLPSPLPNHSYRRP